MIDVFANRLGTNEGGFDASVTNDFGGERAEEGLALIGGFAQFGEFLSVAHHGEGGRAGGGAGGGGEGGVVGHGGAGEGAEGGGSCESGVAWMYVREAVTLKEKRGEAISI